MHGKRVHGSAASLLPNRLGDVLRRQQLQAGQVVATLDSIGTRVSRPRDSQHLAGQKSSLKTLCRIAEAPEGTLDRLTAAV